METTAIESINEVVNYHDFETWWATPLADQINYLKEYSTDHPDKFSDLFSSFCSKYIVCGVSTIRKLLEGMCQDKMVKPLIRIQAAQALLGFEEPVEDFSENDPFFSLKQDELQKMVERNSKKKKNALKVYENVVVSLIPEWGPSALPTPLKVQELIKLTILMPANTTQQFLKYFKLIVAEPSLDESYRLKLIKSIPLDRNDLLFLYLQSLLWFMDDPQIRTTMRIVASEMCLANSPISRNDSIFIHLETWAKDTELDLMIRAQAIDVLLHNKYYPQEKALELFHSIQQAGGHGFGIYNDSQNVHQTDIEDEVALGINKLIKDSQNHPQKQNFKWATDQLLKFIEESTSSAFDESKDGIDVRLRNAKSALNRIELCTRLFCEKKASQLFTMISCLIDEEFSKNKNQAIFLYTRLEEEMADLIQTCATGIASRLINSLSSWKSYGLRISFKEQIKSCFVGRMNALIRELNTKQHSHIFFQNHMKKVVSIYLSTDSTAETDPQKDKSNHEIFLQDLESRSDTISKRMPTPVVPPVDEVADAANETLEKSACEDFASSLFLQMDVKVTDRRCFSLFFGWAFSKISLELATEFKGFTQSDQFQIALREAVDFYQGV